MRETTHSLVRSRCPFALQGTLPDRADPPAHVVQRRGIPVITLPCCSDFGSPEFHSGRWPPEQRAVMSVPEAAVHKKHGIASRKNEIGFSWKIASVQAKPKALAMKGFPDQQFGFRILAADRSHVPAAGSRIMNVRQRAAFVS